MAKYENIEEIGDGSFGKVYQVLERETNKIFALKAIELRGLSNEERLECENEVKLMQELSHPNVIHFHDHFIHDDKLYIVMTCCDGDLRTLINKQRSTGTYFTELEIMHFFVQMILGLNHMHSNDVLHRDIKPDNTFVLGYHRVVLGDLALSKVLDATIKVAHSSLGTPSYMASEIYKNQPYSPKVDIWATGCVLYELMELTPAFNAKNPAAVIRKVLSGHMPEMNESWSDDLKNLVRIMLSRNPSKRPSTDDLLQMDFVKQHIVSFIRNLDNNDQGTQMVKDAVLAANVDLGMVNTGRHKHVVALANQFRDLDIRSLLNGNSETKESTEEVSVDEFQKSPSSNVTESHVSESKSESVPLRESSSSSNGVPVVLGNNSYNVDTRSKDFGSDFEEWNNKLMSINKIDDKDKRIDAHYKFLVRVVQSQLHCLTTNGIRALIQRCSQESLYRCDDVMGNTPLHLAAGWGFGNVNFIHAVLDSVDPDYRNVTDKNGQTPLHTAALCGQQNSIRALLRGADPDYRNVTDKIGNTPLHTAASMGKVDCIRALSDGADPNYRNVTDKVGRTPLHRAASNGHVGSICALLDGADPDYRTVADKHGDTPLHTAAFCGKVYSIRALLYGNREHRNVTNKDRETPLHTAASRGNLDSIRALLDGANPDYRNMTNERGWTPLHTAALHGQVDSIRALLDGANPDYRNMTDESGRMALNLAEEKGHDEVIELLMK